MSSTKYILAAIFFLGSCTPMKIAVSDDLQSSHDEYNVKGRQGILINQKLSFGEFQTTKVRRSWTKGSSGRTGIGWGGTAQHEWVNLISLEYINKKQTLNFTLTDGARSAEVFCVSRFNAEDLHIGKENSLLNIGLDLTRMGGRSESTYYIQLFTKKDETPWQLLLDNQASQAKAKEYTGVFAKSKEQFYTIHPITRLDKNGKQGEILFGSVGYEIKDSKGRAVAAVSLIDKGMVFLAKSSKDERFILAGLCTAILLQEQIG